MTAAVLVEPYLQEVSLKYNNAASPHNEIARVLDMATADSKIAVYNAGDVFRNEAQVLAPGALPQTNHRKVDYISVNPYDVQGASVVYEKDLKNAGLPSGQTPPVNFKQDAIEEATRDLDRWIDVSLATKIKAANWSAVGAGGEDAAGGWSATTSNTFIPDIIKAQATIQKNTGIKPNRLAIDYLTWISLKAVSDITGLLRSDANKVLTLDGLAQILNLEKIVICDALYSTAIEQADGGDKTLVNIYETNAGKGFGFVYYYPNQVGLKTNMALARARTKVLTSGLYRATYEFPVERQHMWEFQTVESMDIKVVDTSLGYHFVDTYAT